MFKNKVTVVTGGASGIGAAICERFGRSGSKVIVLDLEKNAINTFVKTLQSKGIEAEGYVCDVSNRAVCDKVIGVVIGKHGGVDFLVNNAGLTQRSAFMDTDVSVYHKVMDVNFFGSLYCAKAAIKSIIERKGTIIVVSSHAGYSPLYGRTGYSASKHALHGLFESLRAEIKEYGAHVLMVCPGFTRTNLQTRALGADGGVNKNPRSQVGRDDTPEHVAEAVYRATIKKKNLLILTPVGKITYLLSRIMPGVYENMMARKLRHELHQ